MKGHDAIECFFVSLKNAESISNQVLKTKFLSIYSFKFKTCLLFVARCFLEKPNGSELKTKSEALLQMKDLHVPCVAFVPSIIVIPLLERTSQKYMLAGFDFRNRK